LTNFLIEIKFRLLLDKRPAFFNKCRRCYCKL